MTFNANLETYGGMAVVDYVSGRPLPDPATTIPRLRVEWEAEQSARELFTELLADANSERLQGLVIGAWVGEMYDQGDELANIVESLIAASPRLPNLRLLFFADLTYEEYEVSWLEQTTYGGIWDAFPKLTHFGVRGGQGLSLGRPEHLRLTHLIIETGGLPRSVLAEIRDAHLPALEHLELYLGSDNYGWDGSPADVAPLLQRAMFPKLKYLGLRDCEVADDLVPVVLASDLLDGLDELDLSLGTLGDAGGRLLLESPKIRKLKRLNLRHHYLSEPLMHSLAALPLAVDVTERQAGDEDNRYVAIAE